MYWDLLRLGLRGIGQRLDRSRRSYRRIEDCSCLLGLGLGLGMLVLRSIDWKLGVSVM